MILTWKYYTALGCCIAAFLGGMYLEHLLGAEAKSKALSSQLQAQGRALSSQVKTQDSIALVAHSVTEEEKNVQTITDSNLALIDGVRDRVRTMPEHSTPARSNQKFTCPQSLRPELQSVLKSYSAVANYADRAQIQLNACVAAYDKVRSMYNTH
jgi:hypothetical protein